MKITSALFDAFLKCATKCHLRSLGEVGSGNEYAEWVHARDESYGREAALRLQEAVPETERVVAPPATENLKAAKWRLAVDLLAQTPDRGADSNDPESKPNEETHGLRGPPSEQLLDSRLHAVERVPSEGRGKSAQFVPIRFVFRNKLTKDDRLLLALDALILSQMLGREVSLGKIIHGDDHTMLKVKTSALAGEVRKHLGNIVALLSSPAPPDLILNRHCAECEFQARCRKIAIEKDDLSLLAHMSAKERQKLRSKGIFTVTQLSYTFRPRRRPKRQRDKREKYHHSLKALAIREKKIHIVGSPELKIEGTSVYLDVEGLPDRDFYYLIGVRIGTGESAVQYSLWADTVAYEGKIWQEFLGILETVEKPVLVHYGSYETDFLKLMGERHGRPPENSDVARAIETSVNVLSVVFAQVYFPTFTNGLKDIAGFLGFKWSEAGVSGLQTIMWRHTWDNGAPQGLQQKLRNYNEEDCHALEIVAQAMWRLGTPEQSGKQPEICSIAVVHTELLPRQTMWPRFSSPFPEFEQVNKAARWDYQRDRVYVRSSKRLRRIANRTQSSREGLLRINRHVICPEVPICPTCGTSGYRHCGITTKIVHDVFFGKGGIKRWIVEYQFHVHWCSKCRSRFGQPKGLWHDSMYGRNLVAFFLYQFIELGIPQQTVWRSVKRLTGLHLYTRLMPRFKESAMEFYQETRRLTLDRIRQGGLVHVDETRANVRGRTGYVWIFANLHEVAYLYSDSREGNLAQGVLRGFDGVLVSDFYSAYDSLDCRQQKCLIHLMRDLNADVLSNPYDEQLKQIVSGFAALLRPMVETVDQHGLKKHFLRKHIKFVDQFYRRLGRMNPESEPALKCKERFDKNRYKLFTFLEHDGIPWNNNNAEHAVKAFAALREVMEGSSTQKGLEEYLVLLSVCQTCKYMGVDFLDFLRSGEKDIHAFAESRRGRRGRMQTSQPAGLSADAIPKTDSKP